MLECTASNVVGPYFGTQLGLHPSADFRGVMWLPDDAMLADELPGPGAVAVAVGYNAFIGRTCCMHVVIERPELLNRRMVRCAFTFPFVHANCEAVMALVDSTNQAALDFDTRLGFREIARIPNGGTDGDLVVLQMLRTECRWLQAH